MTTTKRRSNGAAALAACALVMLALCLLKPADVRGQWTTPDASQNINNTNGGNVGVGTSTPAAKLHVVGTNGPTNNTAAPAPDALKVTAGVGGNGDWGGNAGGIGGAIGLTGGTGGAPVAGSTNARGGKGGSISLTGGTGGPNVFNAGGGAGGDVLINGGAGVANSPGNVILGNMGGKVGIGTTSPNALLDLTSTTQLSNRIRLSGQEYYQSGNTSINGIDIRLGANRTGERQIWFADSANAINPTTAQLRMRFQGTYATLDSISTDGTTTLPMGLNATGGNVGIGTTAPLTKLHVGGGTRVDGTSGRLYLGTGAVQNFRGLEIVEENATTFSIRHHDPNVAWRNIALNPHGGNVGIGNLAPNSQYKLDVTGNLNASGTITGGTINAKYQDVAEWVESSQSLPAGTVVVLDHTKSNQVVASTEAYDTRVAGVISAQPGITLGESGETKVLVATTGRVKIKVDATRAPIQVGDLLVTGDRQGFAKKSLPVNIGGVQLHRPGTLVGKALEPLGKGTGEILVLLSLQ